MTGGAVAIGLLAALLAGGGKARMTGPESATWRSYKEAWERAGGAEEVAALEAVVLGLPKLQADLARLLEPALAADLAAVVKARASDRRQAIAPVRDEPPGPDWSAELQESMEKLEREHSVLVRLRALRWKDRWIEKQLAPDAAFLASVVEAQAKQLDLVKGRPQELARRGRALVARVAKDLPPIPR